MSAIVEQYPNGFRYRVMKGQMLYAASTLFPGFDTCLYALHTRFPGIQVAKVEVVG